MISAPAASASSRAVASSSARSAVPIRRCWRRGSASPVTGPSRSCLGSKLLDGDASHAAAASEQRFQVALRLCGLELGEGPGLARYRSVGGVVADDLDEGAARRSALVELAGGVEVARPEAGGGGDAVTVAQAEAEVLQRGGVFSSAGEIGARGRGSRPVGGERAPRRRAGSVGAGPGRRGRGRWRPSLPARWAGQRDGRRERVRRQRWQSPSGRTRREAGWGRRRGGARPGGRPPRWRRARRAPRGRRRCDRRRRPRTTRGLAFDGDDALPLLAEGLGEYLFDPNAELAELPGEDERELVAPGEGGFAEHGPERTPGFSAGTVRRQASNISWARIASWPTSAPKRAAGTMPNAERAE